MRGPISDDAIDWRDRTAMSLLLSRTAAASAASDADLDAIVSSSCVTSAVREWQINRRQVAALGDL